MPKDPQLIKSSLRTLHGKSQLFPSDISTIQQALMDLTDNLIELRATLEGLGATAESGAHAKHVAPTASPDGEPSGA
jgi:hypothetical protein